MTVKELIEELQNQPDELEVVFPDYCKVTKVLRVFDPTLPRRLTDTVVLTDAEEYE